VIRVAVNEDRESVFRLVGQLSHAIPLEREAFDQTWDRYFSGEDPVILLVATGEGDAVEGYALTTVVPLLSTNGPSAQLQEIVVDEDARGCDHGTALVRAVEAACVERGVTQLTVASRRAGGFYDRLGFHESAEYMRRFF